MDMDTDIPDNAHLKNLDVALPTHTITPFIPSSRSSSITVCDDNNTQQGSINAPFQDIPKLTDEQNIALTKIEDIFETVTASLIDENRQLKVNLKSRPNRHGNTTKSRFISFPGKTAREAQKFTIILRILGLSHEALITGITTTKRDIYYKDPELFTSQNVVDRCVDDLAYTLGVSRSALNITAAAKGLIAGGFCILQNDEELVDYSIESEGFILPFIKNIQAMDISRIQWILVIEKEAVFRHLATSSFWKDSSAGVGMILTAKGNPDIQTRAFLHFLSKQGNVPPMYALVDFDPYGISILSTYKHGSVALAHETKHLNAPRIQWLGIDSTDILGCGAGDDRYGLLMLTKRDRRRARRMLEEGQMEEAWKRELQMMLMLNIKAEIQSMGSNAVLYQWLSKKLCASGT